jgi:hypothetical protein
MEFHERVERFALVVAHRRFGKTVMLINDLIRDALTCQRERPRVAYIAPLYRQAKAAAWDYVQHYTRPIPGMQYNQSELRADFPNGARFSLYGADNPDSLRGIYLDAAALDEPAQMSDRLWDEVIRPTLSDRRGKATFIGTPQGHDHFYELYERHKSDPDWYIRRHRLSETGYLDPDEVISMRKSMSDEKFEQELELSWTAAAKGAYYGKLIEEAEREGRLRPSLNPDKGIKVETWWDLGIGDSTAIWFAQRVGPETRVLDFYEASGEGLSHYAEVLAEKAKERQWLYGDHVVPHDAKQRSLDTGKTRLETMASLGIKATVQPAQKVEDGIEAVRRLLPSCWFDEVRCVRGLDALRQYRAEYDDVRRTFRKIPVHDWASHAADAFRYGALHKPTLRKWEPLKYDNRGIV